VRLNSKVLRWAAGIFFGAVLFSELFGLAFMTIWSWLFSAACMVGGAVCIFWDRLRKQPVLRLLTNILLVLYGIAGSLCLLLGISMITGMRTETVPDGTPALILGSKVNGDVPSEDLRRRIVTAAAWLSAHPSSIVVACGGQGSDE